MSENVHLDLALKILRIARGLSQKELAEKSGVRNNAISKYESGKAVPKLDTLVRLTKGLDLSLAVVQQAKEFVVHINRLAGVDGDSPAEDGAGAGHDLGLGREIEQVSKDAGRLMERYSALVLELLARGQNPEPPKE